MNIFDRLAERYDSWYDKNKEIYKKELEILPPPRGLSIEIGVGTGRFAGLMGIDVGVDISIGVLKIARKRGVDVILADASVLPFKHRIFDFAYLIFTLCFLQHPERSLAQTYRVLKNDGKLIVCIIPKNSGLGERYMSKNSPFYKVARFYEKKEVEKMLKIAGFRIERIKKLNLGFSECDLVCYECIKKLQEL